MTSATRRDLVAVAAAIAAVAGLVAVRAAVTVNPLARLGARPDGDRTRHGGSIYLPRGGPYMLGFEAPGAAELAIDGAVIARGRGVRFERRVLEAGAHAIELVAPVGARLLWEPVGRRGPAEYVSPSSLSPEPPATARFDHPGTARGDGAIAIAIALILCALVGFLARGWLRRVERPTWLWGAAILALAVAVRLVDLGGAGQTWDEDTNWSAGRNYVTNLLSLDFATSAWRFNLQHPPVTKYLAGLGAQLADGYGPARATSALVMGLACALLVAIGRRLHGLRAGVLAGLVAALLPHLVAHGKVVGHEAPTALLWALAVALCLAAHDRLAGVGGLPADRSARSLAVRLVVIGVVLGLAVSTRFVNALLAPLIGALLLLGAPAGLRRRTLILGLVIVPAVALATAVAIWPRMWTAPFAHLDEAWQILRQPHGDEPFLGALTRQPGAGYFPLYLLATAPIGVLLAAGAWALGAVRRPRRAGLVLLLWLLAPLLVGLSPVRQDGVRYVVPALLALAVMAGAGLDLVLRAVHDIAASAVPPAWLHRLAPAATARAPAVARAFAPHLERRLGGAGGALVLAYLGATAIGIHPYYLDYYGEHVGGPAAVARRRWFETAWWGEGLADAIAFVNGAAAPGARVHKACVEPAHLAWLRADLWAGEVRRAAQAEWIVVYAPLTHACPIPGDAALVFEVSARGAPLARVYRRPPPAP